MSADRYIFLCLQDKFLYIKGQYFWRGLRYSTARFDTVRYGLRAIGEQKINGSVTLLYAGIIGRQDGYKSITFCGIAS